MQERTRKFRELLALQRPHIECSSSERSAAPSDRQPSIGQITPDNRTLFFTELNRPGGKGFGDIYQSRRNGSSWEARQALSSSTSTGDDEFHPSLSPNAHVLYLVRRIARPTSGRPNGDIWSVRLR
jgi:hypothetical protein